MSLDVRARFPRIDVYYIKSQLEYMLPHDTFAIKPVSRIQTPHEQVQKSAQKVIAKVSLGVRTEFPRIDIYYEVRSIRVYVASRHFCY